MITYRLVLDLEFPSLFYFFMLYLKIKMFKTWFRPWDLIRLDAVLNLMLKQGCEACTYSLYNGMHCITVLDDQVFLKDVSSAEQLVCC